MNSKKMKAGNWTGENSYNLEIDNNYQGMMDDLDSQSTVI